MTDYRIYTFDQHGDVVEVVEVDVDNDTDALQSAQSHRHLDPMELWKRGELLRRFEPAQVNQTM